MEEKAALMIKISKTSEEIDALQETILVLKRDLDEIPGALQQEKDKILREARDRFNNRIDEQLRKIKETVANKREEVDRLLDTFPDLEKKEFAGKVEIQTLEDHLREIYPPQLIDDYICLNPIPLTDDGEAYQQYTATENMVANLKQGNIAGAVFNGLSALLDKAADYPQLGLKVGAIFALLMVGGIVFAPTAVISGLAILGGLCASQGIFVRGLLRRMYSVKLYLNDSYDEDIFQQDKSDILASVDEFIGEANDKYVSYIKALEFTFDKGQWATAERLFDVKQKKLETQIKMKSQELGSAQKILEQYIEQLDVLTEKEQQAAKVARAQFLGEVTWNMEWREQMFLDVTPENKIKVMQYKQCNTLFYSSDISPLQALGRLIIFQSMLHMHPNYATTIALDYKYNGGDLTQFASLPDKLFRLGYIEDELENLLESITNRIRSRTNNILGSCESISEYNKLMEEYEAPGEYYVVVHVFGLTKFNSKMVSNIRNGAKVGYFFKFYLTLEEIQECSDSIPLDLFQDIYEVREYPVPRQLGALKRMLSSNT